MDSEQIDPPVSRFPFWRRFRGEPANGPVHVYPQLVDGSRAHINPPPVSPGWAFAQRVSDQAELVTPAAEDDDQYLVEPPTAWSGVALAILAGRAPCACTICECTAADARGLDPIR